MKHCKMITAAVVFALLSAAWCAEAADKEPAAEAPVSTTHSMLSGGLPFFYKATAGYLTLSNDKKEPAARMFYVAYARRGASAAKRPVTFAFNGGPGSSSVWLHLGCLGPRRVALGDDGTAGPPPARLEGNGDSWLPFTDLVFIDPVGTGYSRPEGDKDKKKFYDVKADIESVGDFIRLYLTRTGRWASPVYLCGESYGTVRAVGLLDYLLSKHGIAPRGIVLVSPVLDFATIAYGQNDLALTLALPSYAAAARYHAKAGAAQHGEAFAEAERFSLGPYLAALAQGRALDAADKDATARDLARLTGLSPDYVLRSSLRVPPWRFRKELLRAQSLTIGRMDSRMVMPEADAAGDAAGPDPALDRLRGPFAAAINDYLRRELKVRQDLPYDYLSGAVARDWNWRTGLEGGQGYVDVTADLAAALHANPHLRVFVAAGLYDLATPYFATVYAINHLPLDERRAANIELHTYPAGHMPYTDRAVRRQLRRDAAAFYGKRK